MSTLTRFFSIVSNYPAVTNIFGNNPVRVYPYGVKLNLSPDKPYALYGVFNAVPYNYLSGRSDMDLAGIQVDIYAQTSSDVINGFEAIREAIEASDGYVMNYSTPDRDIEDGLYRFTMEIDFHEER